MELSRRDIAEKATRIAELEQQLQGQEDNVAKVEQLLAQARDEIEQKDAIISDSRSSLGQYEACVITMKNELACLQQSKVDLEKIWTAEKETLCQELLAMSATHHNTAATNRELGSYIMDLSARINAEKASVESSQRQYHDDVAVLQQQLQTERETHSAKEEQLKDELLGLQQQLADAKLGVLRAEDALEKNEKLLEDMQVVNNVIDEFLGEERATSAALGEELEMKGREVGELKVLLADKERRNIVRKTEMEGKDEEIAKLQQLVASLRGEMKGMQERLMVRRRDDAAYTELEVTLNGVSAQLEVERSNHAKALEEKDAENVKLSENLATATAKVTSFENGEAQRHAADELQKKEDKITELLVCGEKEKQAKRIKNLEEKISEQDVDIHVLKALNDG
ncbi:hypothetical protein HK102_000354 [Quaeritorhiza haematococci]|nr:hypothetical protein HK102_000354 [Quaeritorhiza haematococci]